MLDARLLALAGVPAFMAFVWGAPLQQLPPFVPMPLGGSRSPGLRVSG